MVLDYDPSNAIPPTAQCLSPELAVKGVKVADAPGASTVANEDGPKNTKIYVIETSITPSDLYVLLSHAFACTNVASVAKRTTSRTHRPYWLNSSTGTNTYISCYGS